MWLTKYHAAGKPQSKDLTVHFLPPSTSSSLLTNLTKTYAASQISLEEMTVSKVDQDLRRELFFLLILAQSRVSYRSVADRLAFHMLYR